MRRPSGLPDLQFLARLSEGLYVDPIDSSTDFVPPDATPFASQLGGPGWLSMSLELHPLLGRDPDLIQEIRRRIRYNGLALPPRQAVRADGIFHGLLFLRDVKARVLVQEGGQQLEMWRYREGCWLGLPRLWIDWSRATPGQHTPAEVDAVLPRLSFELMERADAPEAPLHFDVLHKTDAMELMDTAPLFRQWVENSVTTGLLRAIEFAAMMDAHPILGSLKDEDRSFLLQLGVLRRYAPQDPTATPELYIDATKKTNQRRVAMMVRGTAGCYSKPRRGQRMTYIGDATRGDLIGAGGVVRQEDIDALLAEEQKADAGQQASFTTDTRLAIRAAPLEPHQCSVWLSEGAEVIEWDRMVLRWVLSARLDTWLPAVRYLGPGSRPGADLPAQVTVFCGARDDVGATTLALGTAAALARSAYDEQRDATAPRERVTWLVLAALVPGLFPPDDWMWKMRLEGNPAIEVRQFEVDTDQVMEVEVLRVELDRLTPGIVGSPHKVRDGKTPLNVAWLDDLGEAELFVNVLRTQPVVGDVVLVVHASYDARVRDYMEHLVDRNTPVVWLHDDPDHERALIDHMLDRATGTDVGHIELPGLPRILPAVLIKADRVTPAYIDRAHQIEAFPHEAVAVVQERSAYPWRHVLRVLDDPDAASLVTELRLDEVLDAHATSTLSRAFWRLKRMIRQRTIGLALGGGGVYGCGHIALIKELEQRQLPIDYIAGASFGALVSGLYAAGRDATIDHYMDVNPHPPDWLGQGILASLWGATTSATFKSLFVSMLYDSIVFEKMLDKTIGESVRLASSTWVACTEIPFMAVGTDIAHRNIAVARSGTVPWAIRLGCCLPPVFPAILQARNRYVDGAILANVPAMELRYTGADFVVAANVVPPVGMTEATAKAYEAEASRYREPRRVHKVSSMLLHAVAGRDLPPIQTLSARIRDTISSAWTVLWKIGIDQGLSTADYCLDLWTLDVSMGSMWWSHRVMNQTREQLRVCRVAEQIQDLWERDEPPEDGPIYRRVLPSSKAAAKPDQIV